MAKEILSVGLFFVLTAASVFFLVSLWRRRGRAGRAAGIVGIAAVYLTLTYLISLWAAKGGWPEGMFYMMAALFVAVPMVVAFAVLLIIAVFGGDDRPGRRVGMTVSFAVLAMILAALVFNRHLRLIRYSMDLDNPDPQKRGYAVLMIGGTGLKIAEPMIIEAAHDESPSVREDALLALSTIDDPDTVEVVRAALDDEDAGVRRTAVIAIVPLGRGGAEVVADLKRMLADPEPSVRMVAANGLDTIDPSWRNGPDVPEAYRQP